jgi:cell division protein YceG involved in septum cleavage
MCKDKGIIQSADAMLRYVIAHNLADEFLIGEFDLSSDMDFKAICEKMTGKKIN